MHSNGSSLASLQSRWASQRQWDGMHSPLLHWNWSLLQVAARKKKYIQHLRIRADTFVCLSRDAII
jgi:hypothetical protein